MEGGPAELLPTGVDSCFFPVSPNQKQKNLGACAALVPPKFPGNKRALLTVSDLVYKNADLLTTESAFFTSLSAGFLPLRCFTCPSQSLSLLQKKRIHPGGNEIYFSIKSAHIPLYSSWRASHSIILSQYSCFLFSTYAFPSSIPYR